MFYDCSSLEENILNEYSVEKLKEYEYNRIKSDGCFLQCERILHKLLLDTDYDSFTKIIGYLEDLWEIQEVQSKECYESYEKYKLSFGRYDELITEKELKESYNKIISDLKNMKRIQNQLNFEYEKRLNKDK